MQYTQLIRVTVAALVVGVAAPAGAQVVNGGFEDPVIGGGFSQTTTVPGWTVSSGSVDIVRSYWNPAEGAQSLDLSGISAGTIYQDLLTTPGGSYDLFFALAGNTDGGDSEKSVRVWWGEPGSALSSIGTFTFSTAGRSRADMGWQMQQALGLVATSGTMRLQFESLEFNAYGAALDDVSLIASTSTVPEPSTVVLLGGGLLALGGVSLRRRARQQG